MEPPRRRYPDGCSFSFRRTKGKLYRADPKCQTHSVAKQSVLNVVLSQTQPHDRVYSLRLVDVTVCLVSASAYQPSDLMAVASPCEFESFPDFLASTKTRGKRAVRQAAQPRHRIGALPFEPKTLSELPSPRHGLSCSPKSRLSHASTNWRKST